MLSLQASVVNGWNGLGFAPDITGAKTFGRRRTSPRRRPNIIATGLLRQGRAATSPAARRAPTPASWSTSSLRYTMGAARAQPELRLHQGRDAPASTTTMVVALHGSFRGQRHVASRPAANTCANDVGAGRRRPSTRKRSPSVGVPVARPLRAAPRGPRRLPATDAFSTATAPTTTGHRHARRARPASRLAAPNEQTPASPSGGAGVFFSASGAPSRRLRQAQDVVEHAGGRHGGAGAGAGDDQRVLAVADGREGDLVVGPLEAEERAGAARRPAGRRRSCSLVTEAT